MSQVRTKEKLERWAGARAMHLLALAPSGARLTINASECVVYSVALGDEVLYEGTDLDAAARAFDEAAKKGGAT